MPQNKDLALSSRMNEQSRGLFEKVLTKNAKQSTSRLAPTSAFRRHQFIKSENYNARKAVERSGETPLLSHAIQTSSPIMTPQTPHYPFEMAGKTKRQQESKNRASSSRMSAHRRHQVVGYDHRRMKVYGYPALVGSNQQQLLCLTPSTLSPPTPQPGNKTPITDPQKYLQRFKGDNFRNRFPPFTVKGREVVYPLTSPTPPLTQRTAPLPRPHTQYRHQQQQQQPQIQTQSKITPKPQSAAGLINRKTAIKSEHLQQYRAQLESYLGPRKKETTFLARRMAPVLRVVPAGAAWAKPDPGAPPKSRDESEATSQKRVTFSDQLGLPLTRNMTPTYRKKHSYILRWLETAGRPAPPLA